jgi:hypothetical protein
VLLCTEDVAVEDDDERRFLLQPESPITATDMERRRTRDLDARMDDSPELSEIGAG